MVGGIGTEARDFDALVADFAQPAEHLSLVSLVLIAQEKGGGEVFGPYEVVENWPQPLHSDSWTWGSVPAVWAESPDRVLVFQRGELPMPVDGASSRLVAARSVGDVRVPHEVT